MQTHSLKPKNKNYKSTQIARGGKRGKTSGRGHKGQKARAGHKIRPEMRDYIKRIPKRRGLGVVPNTSVQIKPAVVNLDAIEAAFNAGDAVNPIVLLEKKLIKRNSGKLPKVKILSHGELTKKVIFSGVTFSREAKEKVVKVGAEIK